MENLYRGYIKSNGKAPVLKYKDTDENLVTLSEASKFDSYCAVLAEDTVLIDCDDSKTAEVVQRIVEDKKFNCRMYKTDRGLHVLFKNKNKRINKAVTHEVCALGVYVDVKVGCKNGVETLKKNGDVRERIYDRTNNGEYDELPPYFIVGKNFPPLLGLSEGNRNTELFKQEGRLTFTNIMTVEEARDVIDVINQYILAEPLTDKEIESITRDDAFPSESFRNENGKGIDLHKFTDYIVQKYRVINYLSRPYIYSDGIYTSDKTLIERKLIQEVNGLTSHFRDEVRKYMVLQGRDINEEDIATTHLACANGLIDLTTGKLLPFTPDIICFNKIPTEYVVSTERTVLDDRLDEWACYDTDVRLLLEEMMGTCLARNAVYQYAFFLKGRAGNGKSTFLKLLTYMLGDKNASHIELYEMGERFKPSMLFGKLANICDDLADGYMKGHTVSLFKKIVSGEPISVEDKGKTPYTFKPTCSVIGSCNEFFILDGGDDAVDRRIIFVPFEADFTNGRGVAGLEVNTPENAQRLLYLAVKGFMRLEARRKHLEDQKNKGVDVEGESLFTLGDRSKEIKNEFVTKLSTIKAWLKSIDPEKLDYMLKDKTPGEIVEEYYPQYTLYVTSELGRTALGKSKFKEKLMSTLGLKEVVTKVKNEDGERKSVRRFVQVFVRKKQEI